MLSAPCRLAQIALAWVWTTAFGRDVVPDVYMMPTGAIGSASRSGQSAASPSRLENAGCPWAASSAEGTSPELSSVTTIQPSSFACFATSPAYCGWVTAPTQRAWEAKYSTSGPALRVFVVTPTAPIFAHAYQARTISGQLSQWIRTLSPFATPFAARPAPIRRVAASNSA